MSLAERLVKKTTNKFAYLLSKDDKLAVRDYISTGNFALNALAFGDPFGGIPSGRWVQFAGLESTGKTFICIQTIIEAQKLGYTIIYYDTEGAQNKKLLIDRGIDPELLIHSPINIVKELQTDMLNMLDEVGKDDKMMFVIDSIGMLSTDKEFDDAKSGKHVRDMTRAQELKSLFRTITVPCAVRQVPGLAINHTYAVIGSMYPTNTVGGGGGSKFASSVIIELTKAKEKVDKNGNPVGALITAKSVKNRLAKEQTKVKVVIDFARGLTEHSGLFDLAQEGEFITTVKQGWFTFDGWEGPNLRRADFAKKPELWDGIFENGFADFLRNKFAYTSHTDGVFDETELEDIEFEE